MRTWDIVKKSEKKMEKKVNVRIIITKICWTVFRRAIKYDVCIINNTGGIIMMIEINMFWNALMVFRLNYS